MTRLKKLILSLGAIFTIVVASVIGFACFNHQKSPVGYYKNKGDVVDNLTPKPTTLTFKAGEVSMQKGGDSINYTYSPSENAKSTYAVAYEYCFGNTMDNPMALDLQTINTTSVNLSYVYSSTKLDLTQGITANTQYKLQTIPNKNDNLYVYILVSPVEGSSTANFDSKVTWYFGIAKTITIENNIDNTTTTQTIISGKEVEKDKLETPSAPTGYYFDAWYRDRNYESLVEDAVTTSSKLCARYANLPIDWLELDTTTDTYYVKRGTTALSNITSLTIPSMYNGKKVTSIMSSASTDTGVFYYQQFTQVSLPNTLIKIGDNAFYRCWVLQSIVIPNSVTSMGSSVFSCCSSLQNVTVSDNILAIGNWSFSYCHSLTDLDISNCTKLTTLNGHIFMESAISSIQLPNSIITISAYSFYLCSNLNKINFPTQLANFGSYAFYGCKTLQEVNLSNTKVSIIAPYTFYQCHKLKNVILPQSLTAINEGAFGACYKLQNVNLEDTSMLSIGAQAFCYAYSLTKVIIPVSVTSMDSTAFKHCCHLHEVWNLSPNVTIVAGGNGDGSDSGYYVRKVYTTMCKSEFITLNNVVYLKKSETSYAVLRKADDSVTHIKLHKYTTEIIQHAFYSEAGDNNLVNVDFSACVNLTYIRQYAFYNNDSLIKLDLSNCKKLRELGGSSFNGCDSLVEVILNDGLEILASQVFEDCDNLATINIPSSVNRMGVYMFRGCPKLTSLTFDTSLTWYKTQNHTDFSNRVNGTVTTLGTPSENANKFVNNSEYRDYYWYHL